MNTATVQVKLTRKEKEQLSHLALRYGFSLPEFSRRILTEIASEIPEESLSEYVHPKKIKASLDRALRDWRHGRVRAQL
ncbi:hypothetical protein HY250_01565 [Candidatus Azambacteria bacterium]|nr:hypothetical protein [Candidatus Azambacteria bacterium]